MIRDRIVVGLRDGRLSEKLKMDSKLTLDTAVATARESEMVKKAAATAKRSSPGKPATRSWSGTEAETETPK